MNPEPAPGWKTSEFTATVGGMLVSLLVALGLVKTGDATNLTSAITNAAVAIGALAASATVIWKYIQSRTVLKVTAAIPPPTIEAPMTITRMQP